MITHEISGGNCKQLALWMTPVHVKLAYRIVSYRMSVCHPSQLVLRLKSPRAGQLFANCRLILFSSRRRSRLTLPHTFQKNNFCVQLSDTSGDTRNFFCLMAGFLFWSNEKFFPDDIKTSSHSSFLSAVQRIICFSPSVLHTFGHKIVIIMPTILFPTRRKWINSHYNIRYDTIRQQSITCALKLSVISLIWHTQPEKIQPKKKKLKQTPVPSAHLAPFEIAMVVSYRLSIVTIALSVTIRPQLNCDRMSPMLKSTGVGHFGSKFRDVPLGADPLYWSCKERTSQAN